ncbi:MULTISPECIES: glycosyltransferase family 4 protein [unclassified Halomonas]|uniref:glycosyltransferase family 4 protein n=1 Tax=unclassified Halomonas TaxID=2609666 RepID=UPI0018D235D5|nr:MULTISPECIES: glycosyltransferase family 4 protein [unclassified Halomonas]QPP48062.1 glycosyltransferase [Halomonas sp. SS10-MC5]
MDVPQDGVFSRVEKVYLPRWRSFLNCLRSLPTTTPLQVAYYQSKAFSQAVRRLVPEHDLALAHLIRSGSYLRDQSLPKVLEMTDAISMNYERVRKTAGVTGLKAWVYKVEQRRLKEYEQRIASDFDLSILVSQVDKDYLFPVGSPTAASTLVCSNGVDLSHLPFSPETDGKMVVFIGNMYSLQNLDAANWFAEQVMPRLVGKGNYVFRVIGRIKDADRARLERLPGVEVTGAVDEVAEHAKGALAGICSVRLGAGVQNKVLEYMALGIPAVVSSVGSEGLEAVPGKDFLIANSVDEYVDTLQLLSGNGGFRSSIAISARRYVERQHAWDQKLGIVSQRVDALLSG